MGQDECYGIMFVEEFMGGVYMFGGEYFIYEFFLFLEKFWVNQVVDLVIVDIFCDSVDDEDYVDDDEGCCYRFVMD